MEKYFRSHATKRWLDVLPDLVYNFNHSVNRMTNATPQDIWDGVSTNEQDVVVQERTIPIGASVRVQKVARNPFTKKSTQKALSKNVWTVVGYAKVGRRYIVQSPKGERDEKLQRELKVVDVEKLETFKAPKATKSVTFKEARKQIRTDQELTRDGIDASNITANTRRRAARAPGVAPVVAQRPKLSKRAAAAPPRFVVGDRVSVYYPSEKRSYVGVVEQVDPTAIDVFFPEDETVATIPAPFRFVRRLPRRG